MSTCLSTSRSNYFDMSIWKKHADHSTNNSSTLQGSETSGRNRFLPGRMEETGKKVFLPVSSGRKWKKLEESGRNWKKYMKPNKRTSKLVEISFQILLSNTESMQICSSQISGILQDAKCPAQCCPIHSIISCIQGLNMLKCLHLEHLIFTYICFDKVLPVYQFFFLFLNEFTTK